MPILRFQQILIAARNFGASACRQCSSRCHNDGNRWSYRFNRVCGRRTAKDPRSVCQLGTNVIIVTPQQSRAVGGRARTGSVVTTSECLGLQGNPAVRGRISSSSPTASAAPDSRRRPHKEHDRRRCDPDYFAIKQWSPTFGGRSTKMSQPAATAVFARCDRGTRSVRRRATRPEAASQSIVFPSQSRASLRARTGP